MRVLAGFCSWVKISDHEYFGEDQFGRIEDSKKQPGVHMEPGRERWVLYMQCEYGALQRSLLRESWMNPSPTYSVALSSP